MGRDTFILGMLLVKMETMKRNFRVTNNITYKLINRGGKDREKIELVLRDFWMPRS